MRCLEKDPRNRPQRADELSAVLESMRMVFSGPHPAVSGSQPAISPTGTQQMGAVTAEPAVSAAAAAFSPPQKNSANALSGKTQNLTLMLTDIKGFTARTSQQTREENARMLKDHDTLLIPVTESYRGKLRQKRGDALLLTFESPTEAVLCGMGIQDALFRFNETVPADRKLNVRVCIHAGEVLVHDAAVFGEPLKVVEKLEGEADGGEVCFTEAVRLQMNRAEVAHEPRGELLFGGNKLAVYKATPAPTGLPFGGRDARDRSLPSLPSKTQMHRALSRFTTLSARTKLIAGGLALLVVAGVAVALVAGDSTAALARKAIVDGRPKEALNIITLAEREKKKLSPMLLQLRAVALHRAGEHGRDLDVLQGVGKSNYERAEPMVYGVLAAHATSRNRDAREVISWLPKERLQAAFEELISGPPNEEQWGALRYLDLEAKTLEGRARVKGYARALENSNCEVRDEAITRLERLGDASAADALERIQPPGEKGPVDEVRGFFGDDCGISRGKRVAALLRKK
jgi:serine/threonine-protein kinase